MVQKGGNLKISTINEIKHISVLNYNENCVCINIAPGKSLLFEESSYDSPTTIPLSLDEIKYANNSNVFKTGALEFQEDLEDELYDVLRIDKNKVLKLSEIREILINPTKTGLQKIISIQSLSDFDRVRGQFQKLKNEGYKLTLDIANLIERRTNELFNNQAKTNIIIDDADVVKEESKVRELEEKLARMEELLKSSLEDKVNIKENISENEILKTESTKTTTRKKAGRPPKVTNG